MATDQDTTTEVPECGADFCVRLSSAGVDKALISEMLDRINRERAEAVATAARLFYHRFGEQGPITPMDFSDELHNMTRRIWGLAAAVDGVLGDRDEEGEASGVLQLSQDVAREMDRLAEAFDAEHWLARGQEALS